MQQQIKKTSRRTSIAGQKFGRWLVISESAPRGYNRRWICKCDCGEVREVQDSGLRSGTSKSCGCLNRELSSARLTKHGGTGTPEYRAWKKLIERCESIANKSYADYGGRGIKVCCRWRKSFANFFADMGARPSKDHSIDRVDVNGNYEPENCRWATVKEQNRNTRTNRLITVDGTTRCVAEWAEQCGIAPSVLYNRLHRGWLPRRAVRTPVKPAKIEKPELAEAT